MNNKKQMQFDNQSQGKRIERYFLRQDSLIVTNALKGITVKTSYSNYDGERNPQTIKTDYGNGILSTTDLTYVAAGSQFLNRIATLQITRQAPGKPGETNDVRKEYFSYDGKGNPVYKVIDSTDVNKVQTVYGSYDKYGKQQRPTALLALKRSPIPLLEER